MSHAVFAHRKNKRLYHPAFFDSHKVSRPAFFDSRKVDYCHALTIKRTTLAVYVANATHKGKKAGACCGVHLLVKSRRFCCFCLFKPGFCKFLAKNPFKKQFLLFITDFR